MSTTVEFSRNRRADLTLTHRLEAILAFDPVAHKALGALLAISFVLPCGLSDKPFEYALSLEVLGSVAGLLLLGLLLVLDYRNWAREQVTEAAREINERSPLRVSNTMELSSDTMWSKYQAWLKQIPAVRIHPWLVVAFDCTLHVLVLKESKPCSWVVSAAQAPCSILVLSSAVASTVPEYFQAQSILAMLAAVAAGTSSMSMLLLKNTCFPCILNKRDFLSVVLGSVVHSGVGHFCFPVMMKHIPVLAAILWTNTVGSIYIAYLDLVDTSGDLWAADPGRWVLLLVVVCTALSQLVYVSARYYISCLNMKAFFRHVRTSRN